MFRSITTTGCQWPSSWTIRTPVGAELPLIEGDNSAWRHQLRDLLRQSAWAEKPLRNGGGAGNPLCSHCKTATPKSEIEAGPDAYYATNTSANAPVRSHPIARTLAASWVHRDRHVPVLQQGSMTVEHILWHCEKRTATAGLPPKVHTRVLLDAPSLHTPLCHCH